ncbi:MAG: hypothetical protein ACXWQO_06765 [Bdellovibrionota bacterium]
MKMVLLALALMAPMASVYANELDNDNQVANAQRHAADLPQTMVMQVNKTTGAVAVLHSNAKLAAKPMDFKGAKFVAMKATDKTRGELDNDSSSSGWYFYWNNYSYAAPTYYYYGYQYSYQPYYNYYNPYNNCNYYYYGNGYGNGYNYRYGYRRW